MTSPRKCDLQILINGRQVHRMLCEDLYSSESRDGIHLFARRFDPPVIMSADNPFLGIPTGTVLDGIIEEAG
jgi:hypothetical protein